MVILYDQIVDLILW